LKAIAVAEAHHEERYSKLLKVLQDKSILKKAKPVKWVCRKCGYEHTGNTPPGKCPACSHEAGYSQLKCEEY
ncbi:MAG: rubredoxin-like domain-containing protein, partial [archaeon]